MSYVRIDYFDGTHEYFENDTLCHDGYRCSYLLNNSLYCRRMRKMEKLPDGAQCTYYKRHNKAGKDWELFEKNS